MTLGSLPSLRFHLSLPCVLPQSHLPPPEFTQRSFTPGELGPAYSLAAESPKERTLLSVLNDSFREELLIGQIWFTCLVRRRDKSL